MDTLMAPGSKLDSRRGFLACLAASVAVAAAVYLACQPPAAAFMAAAGALVDRMSLPPDHLDTWLSLVYGLIVLAVCLGSKLVADRPMLAPDRDPYKEDHHGDEECDDAAFGLGGYAIEARLKKATSQEIADWRSASMGYLSRARLALAFVAAAIVAVPCLFWLKPTLDPSGFSHGILAAAVMAVVLLVVALPLCAFYGFCWIESSKKVRADLKRAQEWLGKSGQQAGAA